MQCMFLDKCYYTFKTKVSHESRSTLAHKAFITSESADTTICTWTASTWGDCNMYHARIAMVKQLL